MKRLHILFATLVLSFACAPFASAQLFLLENPTDSTGTDLTPRGVQELLFSITVTHPDTLAIPLSEQPLIFSGYKAPSRPVFSVDTVRITDLDPNTLTLRRARQPLFSVSRIDRINRELMAEYLMAHPEKAKYLAWKLPDPPRLLPAEDYTDEYLIEDIPVDVMEQPVPGIIDAVKRTDWLHKTDASLQFSQAYISPNWYQGGNNALSLLVNLLWDVRLNEVYHPSLLFESTLSYKLGLNSTPQDSLHRYSVSGDLRQ